MWIYINNLDQIIWLAEKLEMGVASYFIQHGKHKKKYCIRPNYRTYPYKHNSQAIP